MGCQIDGFFKTEFFRPLPQKTPPSPRSHRWPASAGNGCGVARVKICCLIACGRRAARSQKRSQVVFQPLLPRANALARLLSRWPAAGCVVGAGEPAGRCSPCHRAKVNVTAGAMWRPKHLRRVAAGATGHIVSPCGRSHGRRSHCATRAAVQPAPQAGEVAVPPVVPAIRQPSPMGVKDFTFASETPARLLKMRT